MQAFDGTDGFAFYDEVVAHRLHAKNSHLLLDGNRYDLFAEPLEMRVHEIERHLHGIEDEPVLGCGVQHVQVDVGALVAGEAEEVRLAGLARGQGGLHASTRREDAFRIVRANDPVELQRVQVVGLG